jgi:hypothetical protein
MSKTGETRVGARRARCRLDEDERRPPTGPRLRQPCPEHAIRHGQTKTPAARSIHDRQLMPERENLEVHSRARASGRPEREKQRNDDGHHASSLFETEPNFNQRNAYDVSGRHNFR